MTEFLIKSTISLATFLAVYHLFLANEKMHSFNRFYLLTALFVSFTIPFITIEIIQENSIQAATDSQILPMIVSKAPVEAQINWTLFIGLFYALITLVLLFRFVRNISKFYSIERNSEVTFYKGAKLVLTSQKTLPHTFGNRIFINKHDYENRLIEDELFEHELVHVNQKHTIDILFVEILKTILWFNPLLIFYKKAIQLNHEFLADEKVVTSFRNVTSYQSLLLTKASSAPVFQLASQLNFQLTKKRLLMMTKTTSVRTALIKKVALLPILTTLFYFTCFETIAQANQLAADKKVIEDFKQAYESSAKDTINPTLPAVKKPLPQIPLKEKAKKIATPMQETTVTGPEPTLQTENPEFPGGLNAFYQFFSENFKMPAGVTEEAKLIIGFAIEKDGSLTDFIVVKSPTVEAGDEAIRVLKISPKWKPGSKDGVPSKVVLHLPIQIQPKK